MKVIEFDQAAYDSVMKIVLRENYPEAKRIMSKFNNDEISINQQEAQVIVDVLAYEVSRVCLRYPYNDGDDGYEENDEWDDIMQSIYPSTIAFLTPHFDLIE